MKTYLDRRFDGAGFVVCQNGKRERRMVWYLEGNKIMVSTGNWGGLNTREVQACADELIKAYPNAIIINDD